MQSMLQLQNVNVAEHNTTCWATRVLCNKLYGEWVRSTFYFLEEFASQPSTLTADYLTWLRNPIVSCIGGSNPSAYHKGCRGDVREEVNRHSSADEYGCSQGGKLLAAAPAGRVGPSVVPNHHTSLFKVPNTLLQVATETLTRKVWTFMKVKRKKQTCLDTLTEQSHS